MSGAGHSIFQGTAVHGREIGNKLRKKSDIMANSSALHKMYECPMSQLQRIGRLPRFGEVHNRFGLYRMFDFLHLPPRPLYRHIQARPRGSRAFLTWSEITASISVNRARDARPPRLRRRSRSARLPNHLCGNLHSSKISKCAHCEVGSRIPRDAAHHANRRKGRKGALWRTNSALTGRIP